MRTKLRLKITGMVALWLSVQAFAHGWDPEVEFKAYCSPWIVEEGTVWIGLGQSDSFSGDLNGKAFTGQQRLKPGDTVGFNYLYKGNTRDEFVVRAIRPDGIHLTYRSFGYPENGPGLSEFMLRRVASKPRPGERVLYIPLAMAVTQETDFVVPLMQLERTIIIE